MQLKHFFLGVACAILLLLASSSTSVRVEAGIVEDIILFVDSLTPSQQVEYNRQSQEYAAYQTAVTCPWWWPFCKLPPIIPCSPIHFCPPLPRPPHCPPKPCPPRPCRWPFCKPSSSSSTGPAKPSSSSSSTGAVGPAPPNNTRALQDYVAKPDSSYNWTVIGTDVGPGNAFTVTWLNLTSQTWLNSSYVDRTVWWHYLAVIVPAQVNFDSNAVLYITGQANISPRPTLSSGDIQVGYTIANAIKTVVGVLFQVPNQPTVFTSDATQKLRTEDDMVAYTWQQFMKNVYKPELLARLPMTKAVVKAMDAIGEYRQQSASKTINKFVLAGGSKRGWTAWLAAACDPTRVIGIVPIVFDELNIVKNLKHHWRAYGGWSYALDSYYQLNLTTKFDTPEFAQVAIVEDPLSYKNILTMPKLIVSAADDEFLQLDNNDYYWDQLQGEKHFMQFPNTNHGVSQSITNVVYDLAAFALQVQAGVARPQYSWSKDADGALHVVIANTNLPALIQFWSANSTLNTGKRDFRMNVWNATSNAPTPSNVKWYASNMTPTSNNGTHTFYDATVAPPTDGSWVAFNIQMTWSISGIPFKLSTASSILPQTFPYPECFGNQCVGYV